MPSAPWVVCDGLWCDVYLYLFLIDFLSVLLVSHTSTAYSTDRLLTTISVVCKLKTIIYLVYVLNNISYCPLITRRSSNRRNASRRVQTPSGASCCFREQENLRTLLNTGWFQKERIRECFNKLKASNTIEVK
jgi:hypothetical protein